MKEPSDKLQVSFSIVGAILSILAFVVATFSPEIVLKDWFRFSAWGIGVAAIIVILAVSYLKKTGR
jgi:VIT1/CCC1 family predicted Fe2+/Mn2+ transporter